MQIKRGDLIKLGNHVIMCGDSTSKEDVDRLLKGAEIALLLVDEPYGCGVVEGRESFTGKAQKHKEILNDHIQTESEHQAFTQSWLTHVKGYLAPKNAVYLFCIDKMALAIRGALEQEGFKFAQVLIWAKTHAVVGRLDYLPQTESIMYCWYGRHAFHMSKDKNVLVYPKPARSPHHASTKPIGLLRRLILNSSRVNEVVCDMFLGVGSTLMACEQTHRRCVGMEIDPEYCETICMLYERFFHIKPVKL